jgi:hypothetical protein
MIALVASAGVRSARTLEERTMNEQTRKDGRLTITEESG